MDYVFLAAAGSVIIAITQTFLNKKEKKEKEEESVDFGMETFINEDIEVEIPKNLMPTTAWIAFAHNNELARRLLDFTFEKECTIDEGINISRTTNKAFITDNIQGWQLVFANKWIELIDDFTYDKIKSKLVELSRHLGEVQFFCSKPDRMFSMWAKATDSRIERIYVWLGDEHENLLIEGEPTEAEKKYKLVNTILPENYKEGYFDEFDLILPDYGFVYDLAKEWSISPEILFNQPDRFQQGSLGTIKF